MRYEWKSVLEARKADQDEMMSRSDSEDQNGEDEESDEERGDESEGSVEGINNHIL